jgi:hypothetical protein
MTKLKKTIELAAFGNPELGDSSQTYMQEIMNKFIGELQAKKEAVIREKFAEKGFAHLLENLEAKRFKRVVIEQSGDCEKWYADNGTDEGVLIVTFKNIEPKFTNNFDEPRTIKTEIQYY